MSQHTQIFPLVLTESSHSYLNSYLAIERFNIQTCCLGSTARETHPHNWHNYAQSFDSGLWDLLAFG